MILLALAALAGCRKDSVIGLLGQISADPERLDFGQVYVGHYAEGAVGLQSSARFSLPLNVTVEGPFSLLEAPTVLQAGEQGTAQLRFAPTLSGPVEGSLIVRVDDRELRVALVAEGLAPLPCPTEAFCRPRRFDPALGECVEEPRPDGVACGGDSLCLINAHCAAGECVGARPNCDDGNACTTDGCDPARGCVHFDNSARCPSNPDPCLAPLCDPARGCAFAEVEDGVRCGPSDCGRANICLSGKCSEVPVTEGAACGDASPCQKRGVCQNQVCQRPPVQTLTPLWEVRAREGSTLLFDSVADAQGNLYWRECGQERVEVVSVTREGVPRYRLPTEALCASEGMVMLDGTLVLRTGTGVQAFQGFGGAALWSRNLVADAQVDLPPKPASAEVTGYVQHLSRGLPGRVVIALELYWNFPEAPPTFQGTWLLSLDLFTGELRWKARLAGLSVSEMLVDEMSNIYLGTIQREPYLKEFFALTPQGALRWRKPNGFDHPAAVYGGRIYHWNQALSDTATGDEVGRVTLGQTVGYPRLTLGAGFYVTAEEAMAPSCSEPNQPVAISRQLLTKYDPATGKGAWSYEIVGPSFGGGTITNTLLTNRGSILFSQNKSRCLPGRGEFVLREISSAGEEAYQCPLPGPEAYSYFGLLIDDLWAAAFLDPVSSRTLGVRAFAVPGLGLAPKGWVAALGSMSRDHRPR